LALFFFFCPSVDANEADIAAKGGIEPVIEAAAIHDFELQSQCARALRNLSVHEPNKRLMRAAGGVAVLRALAESPVDRIKSQALRALGNLGEAAPTAAGVVAPATAATSAAGGAGAAPASGAPATGAAAPSAASNACASENNGCASEHKGE
jgi:hypothetical protein